MPPAVDIIAPKTSSKDVFSLGADDAYLRWRDSKLRHYPAWIEELMVEVRDPRHPTSAERDALLRCCRRANMAIYVSRRLEADKEIPRRLAACMGLHELDANLLSDEDGISSITASALGSRGEFIPYTNRPIRWHTDGYYNPPNRRIRAMLLHCVQAASRGGANAVLDHEIAYIILRDADREYVRALMAPDAMLIPPHEHESGRTRGAESGPVFSVCARSGHLHMRYTTRTANIEWNPDVITQAAVEHLAAFLRSDSPLILRTRLSPGSGLICNNILHNREGYDDDPERPRLFFRARYIDRIDGPGPLNAGQGRTEDRSR